MSRVLFEVSKRFEFSRIAAMKKISLRFDYFVACWVKIRLG